MGAKRDFLKFYFVVLFLLLVGCTGETVESENAAEINTEDKISDVVIEEDLVESEPQNDAEVTNLYNQAAVEEVPQKTENVQTLDSSSDTAHDEVDQIANNVDIRDFEEKTETENEAVEHEVEASEVKQEHKEAQENPYDYSDFVGYYLHYTTDDRSESDMIVTIGNEYLMLGWYLSEFELYEIIDWSIDQNILTIDYYLELPYEGEGAHGRLSINLFEENGEKYIDFGGDMLFYETSYDKVQNYGYTLPDFLIEDINQ